MYVYAHVCPYVYMYIVYTHVLQYFAGQPCKVLKGRRQAFVHLSTRSGFACMAMGSQCPMYGAFLADVLVV